MHLLRLRHTLGISATVLAFSATWPPLLAQDRDFIRGDANDDGAVDITDPIFTLRMLFAGGPPSPCADAADGNDDGAVELSDATYTLGYLFRGGPKPPAPGLVCGPDETEDALPCNGGKACLGDTAPPIPIPEEHDRDGNYAPYHTPGPMSRPRYLHELVVTPRGMPVVMGGTDERGYSALDTAELFDPYSVDKNHPVKDAGFWIDTDFEGDPIQFRGGPRIRFTACPLGGSRILVTGGTSDLAGGAVYATAEVLDVETRRFEVLASTMVHPRFRAAAIELPDGNWIITGGQVEEVVAADPEGPAAPARRFPTTPFCELFLPAENRFVPLLVAGMDQPSLLATPRGRAGHAIERLAGPDGRLRTPDDLFVIAGGFQTLDGSGVPDSKLPGAVGRGQAEGVKSLEVFDPESRSFVTTTPAALSAPRINDPQIANLGLFNDLTLDGVRGMGNLALVTHGNDDDTFVTAVDDDLFSAIFTGFGPLQGLQLFRIADPLDGHSEGVEYAGGKPDLALRGNRIGRCGTNVVVLPRALETNPNAGNVATWVVALVGADMAPGPAGVVESFGPTVRAGCVFDPFYSLPALAAGRSTRDLDSQRSPANPLGVVGCWLTLDGAIPTGSEDGFGSTPVVGWARPAAARRVHSRNVRIPGKDRVPDTADDVVLLTGGSLTFGDALSAGAEPTEPSSEIFVPPGANAPQPSP